MSKEKKTRAQEKAEREAMTPSQRARRELYDWIQSLMAALIFCVLLFSFLIRLIDVKGPSMNPTRGTRWWFPTCCISPRPGTS